MSSGAAGVDSVEAAVANFPAIEKGVIAEGVLNQQKPTDSDSESESALQGPNGEQYPTKEELATLRHVVGKVNWIIYSIAFIELCERFAYYGTTAVFVNFIQQPMPEGSTTGAAPNGQPGALGYGQRASTGLTTFNSFWAYLMPLVGGWLADTYWGKYKTINVAIAIATFGHIIIIISAIPQVMTNPSGALGCFSVGLIFFGMGVGFFKCNISPMIAEQYEHEHPRAVVITLKSGERVIDDPIMTISHIYMRYYFFINVGALVGQLSMVYAEKYVGFWLSYTLPTILFLICPFVMIALKNKYVRTPPTGSVVGKSTALLALAMKGRWSFNLAKMYRNCKNGDFWDKVKPSKMENPPAWMTFDDAWVDEVRRGIQACKVFVYYPIFWLPYSQMTNNLVSQAATLQLNGIPNDIIHNLNPLFLLVFIPICDKFIYPSMARAGIKFTPIKKITAGFATATLAMVVACIIQYYIYKLTPCADGKSTCDDPLDPTKTLKAPISVWVQSPAYILIALSEICASITGLEYAFTKAPRNMRSLVTGLFWFAQAFSSAIGQAFVGLSSDPLLVWLYMTVALLAFLGGVGFWFNFRELDTQEEILNALPDAVYHGARNADEDLEAAAAEQAKQDKIREKQGLK